MMPGNCLMKFLTEMRKAKMSPDKRTLLSVLSACAMSGALDLGNLVHSWIDECGLGSDCVTLLRFLWICMENVASYREHGICLI